MSSSNSNSPLPYNRQNALASTIAVDNAANIAGKTILTTGVTLGSIGAQFVEEIAQYKPALLILAGRTPEKLQAMADKLKSNPKNQGVAIRTLTLDLASQTAVREAATEVLAYPEPNIDVIVTSAGIMAGPYRKTPEGIELQFGSNHIGHFLFTNLIMSKILASKSPRVVSVSSDGHRQSRIRFDDYNFADGKSYNQWVAYGQSKSANILFANALAEKLGKRGLRVYSLHPGVNTETGLANAPGLGEEDFADLKRLDESIGHFKGFDIKSLDEMAATYVVAAFDPRIDAYNGTYLENGNLCPEGLFPTVKDPEDVEKLWELSEKLVGQKFEY